MGKTTDGLIALAAAITPDPRPREMDMLLATGEQVTIALLRWRCRRSACRRARFTGAQVGIVTDSAHTKARIKRITRRADPRGAGRGQRRRRGRLPGHGPRTATSRRSAAAAPTSPPSRSPPRSRPTCARSTPTWTASTPPIPASCPTRASSTRISYDEMLEMASLGAGVMQPARSSSPRSTTCRSTSAPPSSRTRARW